MPSRDSEKQPQILGCAPLRGASLRMTGHYLQRPVKSLRKKSEEKANRLERPLLGEGHVCPPAGIQPEAAARIGGHLHRHGPLHLIVGRRTHREHIVRANVGHHELVVRDEPDPGRRPPPGSGPESHPDILGLERPGTWRVGLACTLFDYRVASTK